MRGEQVKIISQSNSRIEADNLRELSAMGADVAMGSVTDRDFIFRTVAGADIVFHLAAAQHEANAPDALFWNVNVTGTQHMLDASVATGVKRFIHGSTIGVYGKMEGVIDENSPCSPTNIYGITKLEGERLVLSYREKIPISVIRISETYGPGDYRLLKLFKVIGKGVFFMIGSGGNLHHPVYIDDLINGFYLIMSNRNAIGKIFILAGPKPFTSNEMVSIIASEMNTRIPMFKAPVLPFNFAAAIIEDLSKVFHFNPPLHRRRLDFFKTSYQFLQTKAGTLLMYSPKIEFNEGVKNSLSWYRNKKLIPM